MFKKRIIGAFAFFLLLSVQLFAQRTQFVYLQTETMKPFFVVLNKKNFSSSSAGHVILPGLTPGNYNIQVGFPGSNNLQDYTLAVSDADQGYLVKKNGETEYAIVNLQTSAMQRSGEAKQAIALAEAQKKQEEELAKQKAADEERLQAEAAALAVKEQEQRLLEAKAAEEAKQGNEEEKLKQQQAEAAGQKNTEDSAASKKVEEIVPVQKQEAAVVATAAKVQEEAAKSTASHATDVKVGSETANPVVVAGVLSAAEIARLQEEARKIDARGQRDSVLAAEKAKTTTKTQQPVFLEIEMTMPDSAVQETEMVIVPVPEKEAKMVDTILVAEAQTAIDTTKQQAVVPEETKKPEEKAEVAAPVVKINPNCEQEASDADLELVSLIIKGEKNPDDALDILRKTVKVKCINTQQLRKLCLLFAADQHRYGLLDLAYRYTSDQGNYGNLSDLLTDVYYLNRFKAMLQ